MPVMATLSLNDSTATPVSYTVQGETGGVGIWADTSQGSPAGFRTILEQVKRPSDPSKGVTRVLFRIARPHVNTTTGLVDYICRANVEVLLPVISSNAERKELYAMLKNYIADNFAQKAIEDVEGVW